MWLMRRPFIKRMQKRAFFPGGLGAMFARMRDAALRWYAVRKGIRVPSLVADTRVDDFVATDAMVEAVAEG